MAVAGCGAGAFATTGAAAFGRSRSTAFSVLDTSFPLRRWPYFPLMQARSQIHVLSRNSTLSSPRNTARPDEARPDALLERYSMQKSLPTAMALVT
jgi:hypothetical protein